MKMIVHGNDLNAPRIKIVWDWNEQTGGEREWANEQYEDKWHGNLLKPIILEYTFI